VSFGEVPVMSRQPVRLDVLPAPCDVFGRVGKDEILVSGAESLHGGVVIIEAERSGVDQVGAVNLISVGHIAAADVQGDDLAPLLADALDVLRGVRWDARVLGCEVGAALIVDVGKVSPTLPVALQVDVVGQTKNARLEA